MTMKKRRTTRESECPPKQVVGLQKNREEDLQLLIHVLIPLEDLVVAVDVGLPWVTEDERPLEEWEETDRRSVENREMQDVVPFHLFLHPFLLSSLPLLLLPLPLLLLPSPFLLLPSPFLLKTVERNRHRRPLPFHPEERNCAVLGVWWWRVAVVEEGNVVKKRNRLKQIPKEKKGMKNHLSFDLEERCEILHFLLLHLLEDQKSCHPNLVDVCQRASWRR